MALIISDAVIAGFFPVIAKASWLLYSSFFGCTLVFGTEMQNQFGLIVKRNICWMKQRERERERGEREMRKYVSYKS